ncbi:T9SS type A sorting domain-containing protein [bacterium]|nr:T9SS type A sorting domain-containing protein [bacterium]
MRVIRIPLIILLLVVSASTFARTLDFVLDATFTIPTDTVREATFRDIDSDGWPEALLVGGDSIWLYSLVHDSVLFTTAIPDPNYYEYSVTLADVNRDSVIDLVLGGLDLHYTRVDVWDGAARYAAIASRTYGDYSSYYGGKKHGVVASLDVDRDGYDELVASYDDESGYNMWSAFMLGGTVIYSSFPDQPQDSLDTQSLHIDSLRNPDGSFFHVTQQHDAYTYLSTGPDWTGHWSWLVAPWDVSFINALAGVDFCGHWTEPECGEGVVYTDHWSFGCGGELDTRLTSSEFLCVREAYSPCEHDGAEYVTWDSTQLYLFSLIASESTEEIWHKDISGQIWDNFLYHQGFPGYFFAFVDDDFIMYDVTSDTILQTNHDVPVGKRSWTWPYPDKLPRLVTLDANHVTLYRLDISTAIGDQPGRELPESFTLSEPYPNPFNPAVSFSITLPVKTNLTVEIYNTLGQRVERLFDGDLPAGEKLFEWDGTDYASGVYLIKAANGSETKSVKAVLVK